jgi:hypothetical protein
VAPLRQFSVSAYFDGSDDYGALILLVFFRAPARGSRLFDQPSFYIHGFGHFFVAFDFF